MRVVSKQFKDETQEEEVRGSHEDSTSQDLPNSRTLCVLQLKHEGQVEKRDRKREHHCDAKDEEEPGGRALAQPETEESNGKDY
jgi:hypothetical protein